MKKILPLIGSIALLFTLDACKVTTSSSSSGSEMDSSTTSNDDISTSVPDINDFSQDITLEDGLKVFALAYENTLNAESLKINADLTDVKIDKTTTSQTFVDGELESSSTLNSKISLTSDIGLAINMDATKTVDQAFKAVANISNTDFNFAAKADDNNSVAFEINFDSIDAYLQGTDLYLDVTGSDIYDQVLEIIPLFSHGDENQVEQIASMLEQMGEKIVFDLSSLNNSTSSPLPVVSDVIASLPTSEELIQSFNDAFTTSPLLKEFFTCKSNGEDTLININITEDEYCEFLASILSSSDPSVPPYTVEDVKEIMGDLFGVNNFNFDIIINESGYVSYLATDVDMRVGLSSTSSSSSGDENVVTTSITDTTTADIIFNTSFTFDFAAIELDFPSDLESFVPFPLTDSSQLQN